MFWSWLLKYSSFLVTGVVSFFVGYLLWLFTTKRANLIFYVSQTQWVRLPNVPAPAPGPAAQQLPTHLGTGTLFLWNAGKAPAREVHVGHHSLPAHGVFPDIPRNIVNLLGGGIAIQFPIIPPKTLVSVSYLLFPPVTTIDQIVSYVGSENGYATRIPVMLQRIFPKWVNAVLWALLLAGIWVAVNAAWSLTKFLWVVYYR